jgi:large subunit ribosomal protein L17
LGKIETTEAKAKELRPLVEKLVTRAKKPSIANRRLLVSRTGSVSATAKLMRDIAPKYSTRKGGYTRVIKLAPARGDGSKRAIIEFV